MTYMCSIANKRPTKIIKKTVEIMTRREKKREGWKKGGDDEGKGGQLHKEDCSVAQGQGAGSGRKWSKLWGASKRCRNWRGDLKTKRKTGPWKERSLRERLPREEGPR